MTAYFNPLHREGGDVGAWDKVYGMIKISIHSTARVETPHIQHSHQPRIDFNPLHREGGDVITKNLVDVVIISIHSTARVETVLTGSCQSRVRKFQSTPPRGWRPCPTCTYAAGRRNFNPLHREGGDRKWYWSPPPLR